MRGNFQDILYACKNKERVIRNNKIIMFWYVVSYVFWIIAFSSLVNPNSSSDRESATKMIIWMLVIIGILTMMVSKKEVRIKHANKQIVYMLVDYLSIGMDEDERKQVMLKVYEKNTILKVYFKVECDDLKYANYLRRHVNDKLLEVQKQVQDITNIEMFCV